MKKNIKWIILTVIIIILLLVIGYLVYPKLVYLSEENVKEVILKETNLKSEEVEFDEIKLNRKKERYSVIFFYRSVQFKYTINAKNGKVIKNNFDSYGEVIDPIKTIYITEDEAKLLIYDDTGFDPEKIKYTKSDLDKSVSGKAVYTFEFKYNKKSYVYIIDGVGRYIIMGYEKSTVDKQKK